MPKLDWVAPWTSAFMKFDWLSNLGSFSWGGSTISPIAVACSILSRLEFSLSSKDLLIENLRKRYYPSVALVDIPLHSLFSFFLQEHGVSHL